MTSECESVRKRLCAYLGHDLDWREGERINLHLQHCPSCRTVYLQYRGRVEGLRRNLRDWACENRLPEGWNEGFREGLMKAAGHEKKRVPPDKRNLIPGGHRDPELGERIKIPLILVGGLLLVLLVSPFLSWLTMRLPYYGPLVKKILFTDSLQLNWENVDFKRFFG